jgi:nucleotide-binding universal stress UspA family protein
MSDYKTILVPYDFSGHARRALEEARGIAARQGSSLHLLHVVQPPTYGYAAYGGIVPPVFDTAALRESAAQALADLAAQLGGPGKVESHVTESPNVAASIEETAKKLGADLIVMGTHGRTGLAHVFLGSVAERTLRVAPCPVLTVRASESEE